MGDIRDIRLDILEQFRDKPNIEKICKVLDKHLNDAYSALMQVKTLTSLQTATGKQLDLIGDIVGLTRAEAALLCKGEITFDVLDDERYRKYLMFQSFRNSNDCTYFDLVNALNIVWGVDEIKYVEDENYPATILITVPDEYSETICDIPPFCPAGVGVAYLYNLHTCIEVHSMYRAYKYGSPVCGTLLCGVYPQIATIGGSQALSNVVVEQQEDTYPVNHKQSGTYPEQATLFKGVNSQVGVGDDINDYKKTNTLSGQAVCGIYF